MKHLFTSLLLAATLTAPAQTLPPVFGDAYQGKTFNDSRVRTYIAPQRIVWQYDGDGKLLKNADALLTGGNIGQSELSTKKFCTLISTDSERPGILFDFGKEIQGGLQLVTTMGSNAGVKIRVRFGESVSEAMSEVGKQGATNDHAMRDFEMTLPWLGVAEVGNSGFRFVRIDVVTPNAKLELKEVNAIFTYRDIPYLGSFRSNDERLNQIWMTGAYTVHLNMQEYIWDGIKRDRLVWLGDFYTEMLTVNTVFGYNDVIPKSLDFAREFTPLPGWMNGMFSYSLWWIIIHRDWYLYQGNLDYLKQQQAYLTDLLHTLLKEEVDDRGKRTHTGGFLDWPASPNVEGVEAGMYALMVMAFDAGAELCTVLGDPTLASECKTAADKMRTHVLPDNNLKQAAALQAVAGIVPAKEANDRVIAPGGAHGFSVFGGYFMLQTQAMVGDYKAALDNIRTYWGGMLDMGATTFWEGFDIDWMKDAAPIDELVPAGKKDIHGDFGDYCYKNFRHSLCHGWASGPTAWLTEHVLGIRPLEPGCRKLLIDPHLGDLEWVEGSFPTPYGVVKVKHTRTANGQIETMINAPAKVKIVRKK